MTKWTFFAVLVLSLPLLAAKPELRAITDAEAKNLHKLFSESSPLKPATLKKTSWNCELFGMRSRMQVQKKKRFYQFKLSKTVPGTLVANNGAQIIKSYKTSKNGFIGEKGPLSDLIRITKAGKLVSELSIPTRDLDDGALSHRDISSQVQRGRTVLAYAVCE